MRCRWLAAIALLVGCGSSDPKPGAKDSGVLSDASADARRDTGSIGSDARDASDSAPETEPDGALDGALDAEDTAVADVDPDAPLSVSIDDVSIAEGDEGTKGLSLIVRLSAPSALPVTVDYATSDGTGTAGVDYVAETGKVVVEPGLTTVALEIVIQSDVDLEPDETVHVTLSNPQNAELGKSVAVATIVDDDAPPALSVADVTKPEGAHATTTPFTFEVTLSRASAVEVKVSYATTAGTATPAIDYLGVSGTLSFAPGETKKLVTVMVNGNNVVEPDETFFVELTAPTGADLAKPKGTGTIANDD